MTVSPARASSPSGDSDLRRRHGRGWPRSHPFPIEVWIGVGLLAAYAVVGVSAIVVFGSSLSRVPTTQMWVPPYPAPPSPSWSHPFGVLSGVGTGLFTAIWRATPWDLAIVFSILSIDGALALVLGSIAGMTPRGWVDRTVTFVSDSIGSVPPVMLLVVLLLGLSVVARTTVNLPIFVLLFGLLLWPPAARGVRSRARRAAQTEYVEASRASGARESRILVRHVFPASIGPVLAQIPVDVAAIFLMLSAFTWIANCVNPADFFATTAAYPLPTLPPITPLPSVYFPEWGNLLGIGMCWGLNTTAGPDFWWMYTFPLLAIVGLGIALALLCDGLDRWLRVAE